MPAEAECRAEFVDLNAEPLERDIWEITIMAFSNNLYEPFTAEIISTRKIATIAFIHQLTKSLIKFFNMFYFRNNNVVQQLFFLPNVAIDKYW